MILKFQNSATHEKSILMKNPPAKDLYRFGFETELVYNRLILPPASVASAEFLP